MSNSDRGKVNFADCGQEERDSSTLEGKSGVVASISSFIIEGIEEVTVERGHDGSMCLETPITVGCG